MAIELINLLLSAILKLRMLEKNRSQKISQKPELLSPAGDWDSMRAAILNGADAVYLGIREFNARAQAKNFSFEELKKAVEYAHTHGVRVYLTMNVLVKNEEIGHYFDLLSDVYHAGIDGVIIQHLSFVEIIKANYPDLAVIISTQGAVGNLATALLVKKADRIIVPRELSLDEIKNLVNSGIEVEVFVHGALCFSYSGLCLFSSFVSNRSGNRGHCAQTCRQKFNGGYPLSTRELCLVKRIPELIQSGIKAFKIEGRMRSALYVAVATRLYRKAIDSYLAGKFVLPLKEINEIEIVFNREFTEGLIMGDRQLISPDKPLNRGAFLGKVEDGFIHLRRELKVGDGIGIWDGPQVNGAIVRSIVVNGQSVEKAQAGENAGINMNLPNNARIYLTSSTDIKLEPDFNTVRSPIKKEERPKRYARLPLVRRDKSSASLVMLARAYSLKEAKEIAGAGADVVFYNIFAPDFPDPEQWQEKSRLGAYIPRIINDSELKLAKDLLKKKSPEAVLLGNPGFLIWRSEFNIPFYLDYSINVFNDLDVLFYRKFDAIPVLSPELSLKEMINLKSRDVVIFCHGNLVMVNTLIELKDKSLTDEKGYKFPVRKEGRYWQILNSRPFGMFNDIRKLRAAGFGQFLIDQESRSSHMISLYRNILQQEISDRRLRKGYTSGHLYRPVD